MRYSGIAQSLHWITVLLFVITVTVALVLPEEPETAVEFAEYSAHKSLGLTIFLVTILRLVWRRMSPPPPLPPDIAAWERAAARTIQFVLYAALIAQPVLGVLMVWCEGSPIVLFGYYSVPTLLPDNETFAEAFDSMHYYIGWGLIDLATIHALAALRHHFVSRDDVLNRMLPAGGSMRTAIE